MTSAPHLIRGPRLLRHHAHGPGSAGVVTLVVLAGLLAHPARVIAADPTPVGEWQQFDDRKGDLRSVIRIDLVNGELVGTIVKAVLRPGAGRA